MASRLIAALLLSGIAALATADEGDRNRWFDNGWRFVRGDAPGASGAAFNDSHRRQLDVPHDWSIEDLPPRDDQPIQIDGD